MIYKIDGKRIGVWGIDKGIPPHGGMTLGVRERRRIFVGFDQDLRSVAADIHTAVASVTQTVIAAYLKEEAAKKPPKSGFVQGLQLLLVEDSSYGDVGIERAIRIVRICEGKGAIVGPGCID
jgi:hypothetical protein